MSRGGGYAASAQPAATTVSAAQEAAQKAADEVAAKSAKKMKNEVGAEGSSILTSGAGILDDTELKRNLLGANAYRAGSSNLG